MYGLKLMIMRSLKFDHYCRSHTQIVCRQFPKVQLAHMRSYAIRRFINRPVTMLANDPPANDGSYWPRKIFSGIQPTGALHLGNYLGAVRKWTQLQEARDNVTYCIVDMHSITLPQDPAILRENIFKMAATMLACGIDPHRSTIFVQSAVKEHSELCWLLGTLCTMARLGHLPQYKDKTRQLKEIPLGLFVYPILQAADIMLYKTTHVPVGEDQVQHIQLTQHLAKIFNSRFGRTFPICHAIIEDKEVSRIRSLRDPSKKMSKSDPDPKSVIYITDPPDVVVEKVKKAVTDFCSDVSYDAEGRPGVSNLIAIHSHMSGQSIDQIISEARTLDTGKYKLRVAEAINEHLKPIREKIEYYLEDRNELVSMLDLGAEKARNVAFDTVEEVKHRMGLGAPYLPLFIDKVRSSNGNEDEEEIISPNHGIGSTGGPARVSARASATETAVASMAKTPSSQTQRMRMMMLTTTRAPQSSEETSASLSSATASKANKSQMLEAKSATLEVSRKSSTVLKPMVPQQRLRIEKVKDQRRMPNSAKPISVASDITKGLLNKELLQKQTTSTTNSNDEDNSSFVLAESKVRSTVDGSDSNSQTTKSASNTGRKYGTSSVSHTVRAVEKMRLSTEMQRIKFLMSSSKTIWDEHDKMDSNGEDTREKILPGTHKTIKRHLTTTTTVTTRPQGKNSDEPRYDGSSPKSEFNRKIVQRTIIIGGFVIGAGFCGVYYFWRSIFKAYFESKKNGGG